MWTSQVSKEAFDAALKESLASAGYTSDAPLDGQYKIDADLVTLKQPLFGLTFNVVSTVNYRVYKEGFEKLMPITATGTATTSDAFVAITRSKLQMKNQFSKILPSSLNSLRLAILSKNYLKIRISAIKKCSVAQSKSGFQSILFYS